MKANSKGELPPLTFAIPSESFVQVDAEAAIAFCEAYLRSSGMR
jgi:hypothetical protein